jgi:signal transduction histidine kinase/ActR/RegA family two-component response regulator
MHLPEHRVMEHNCNQLKDGPSLPSLGIELQPAVRADLLDPVNWHEGLETFARATNLAVALVDANGFLLGECANPRPTWRLFHDKKPAAVHGCPFSIATLKPCTCVTDALAGGGFVVTRDPTGLVHFAVPLQLGEHRLGALVAGQVFDHYPEQLPLEQVANAFGLPRHEVWQRARLEHPINKESLRVYRDLLATLGRTFLLTRYHATMEADHVAQMTRLSDLLAEADRRNEFLAMLAHELRNPLAPVQNALELMRLCPADRLACARARDVAAEQIQHLSRLVDDLVDVSRISHGRIRLRKEIVDLAQFVHQAVESVRTSIETQGQRLSISLPHEPIHLQADPTRLVQVISNLLNNAMKYTQERGRIWLSADREEHEVVLRVRDTGIGMSPELLPRVFDLFTQGERGLDRSQGGLGIGLTMVRSLVEMHGGSVIGRSDGPGQGSEFIVRLPVLPQTQRFEQPPKAPKQRGNAPSRRVLVVDDSISTAETMAALLQMKGHDLRVANDGTKAVEIAAGFQPEVVLLDIGMPGMNGYQVAKKLRQMPGLDQTLLIALSGYGQEEDLRCSHEAGFHHHLVKPASLGVVEELVGFAAVPKSPKSVCAEAQPCRVLEGREPSIR